MVQWQTEPELREVEVPEPGPGQILIKVAGAGACHSDLHLMEGPPGAGELPFTIGHENAGWVEALGAGVEGFEVGEPVAVYGPWGCGRCHECRESKENYCERHAGIGAVGGLGLDGGMAEFMLVPAARLLVPLDGLDPIEAAPLTDAGLTSYHAIKRSLHRLVPGSSVVVIGVGGLGHLGVQILKAMCAARVIAADIDESKLRLAREVGADETVRSGGEAASQIRELTHGLGAQLVLDFVGATSRICHARTSGGCTSISSTPRSRSEAMAEREEGKLDGVFVLRGLDDAKGPAPPARRRSPPCPGDRRRIHGFRACLGLPRVRPAGDARRARPGTAGARPSREHHAAWAAGV